MNKLEKHISKILPEKYNISLAYGEIALLTYRAEKKGNKLFASKNFKSERERAKLLIPWLLSDTKNYEHELDVLECTFLMHRYLAHNEKQHYERIQFLYNFFSDYEKDLVNSVEIPNPYLRIVASIPLIGIFARIFTGGRGFWGG